MNKNITCKKAVDYLSKKEEGKLGTVQRFQLWRHLASCSLCRIFSEQNTVIARAFRRSAAEGAGLSSADKLRILEAARRDG
jgi:predicted anti-sigma-YlaC factor YlaD